MIIPKMLSFDDVMLVPGYGNNSRDDGSVETNLGRLPFKIPILSANMDCITGEVMADKMGKLGGLGILHRFVSIKQNVQMFQKAVKNGHLVGVSVGVGEEEKKRADALFAVGARIICVDIAHAHTKSVENVIKHIKGMDSSIFVIGGNVCVFGGADFLVGCGADAVKIGLGSGSVCITSKVTGFGMPLLSAIFDCARISKPIIADGGMRTSGDIVKALAAGASMVMLGRMLAGTNEACGTSKYRGMASKEARESVGKDTDEWRAAEGISIDVEDKGPVADVIKEIVGGIKSGLSYAGAKNLEELRRKARFIEVTR